VAGATVTEVVPDEPDGVRARYRFGCDEREVRARSAVVATPAFVAREIVRGLPPETANALAAVRYGPYVVGAFLTAEDRPMPWDGIYALATPGRSFGMLFNTANVLRSPGACRRREGGALMVYAAAGAAKALDGLDDAEVAERFGDDLCGLFPQVRGLVRELVIRRWPRGLPYAAVGRSLLQRPLTRPLGAVQLAGDYLGTWYTETAAQTAEAAAAAARARVGRPTSAT
jgi:protoporphyrinogen/coproporphyrinogen III oxidase